MTEVAEVDVEAESGRAALGRALKFLREKAGLSLGQLAVKTRYDKSYLYRLETGKRLSKLAVMEDLDRFYETGGLLVELWKVARREVFKDKYKEAARLELSARIMHLFTLGIPGLLQTEDVARALLSGDQETESEAESVEEQVIARLDRQQLLYRNPAPTVRIIIDEYGLRRQVGSAKVWEAQLEHLIAIAQLPMVTLQVLPLSAGAHHLMDGSLTLMWQEDGSAVAYMEGNQCSELLEDPTDVTLARLSYDRGRDLALPPPDSIAFIRGVLKEFRGS
ncbi:helix-turn-helix transcriptional regulator [Streptomyces microflavus]|uniref:Transcriptional regulator, XRE family n=1 Tax=Streptomyces microflavus DSM 40593 TaxID=1303692 RepID=N0CNQ8_STRMI|nr:MULTISPECIES: helix-turn-helix transcriptional regulator [Streptomyces]AGK77821.1 Transcriptional regulator, XRE family [Streptomyces microflavus DSM 40593]MCX4653042.1 helix-turn-helix domain-containing protein [Streptomyces microflavus]SCK40768.1 Helix-turn-helix domain-containing protein [Streptomyces sp. ScaeMP-e48]